MAAQTVSGSWKRTFVGYSGARVWGTGVNPVHYYYGSGRERPEIRLRESEITPPFEAVPDQLQQAELWGYTPDLHSLYSTLVVDDRPNWTEDAPLSRDDTDDMPSWAAPGSVTESFRAKVGGAYRNFRGITAYTPDAIQYQEPSETVSEGWVNKPKGTPADSKPSDPSQYEMQTSMQQRYATRNNDHAVARGTDAPRAPIASKVTGQRIKVYSGGERHYDMFPKQQDLIPRPFWYRTAGVGRRGDMIPNTLWSIRALERVPPPDPSIGQPETAITSEYGYTSEDAQYYAG